MSIVGLAALDGETTNQTVLVIRIDGDYNLGSSCRRTKCKISFTFYAVPCLLQVVEVYLTRRGATANAPPQTSHVNRIRRWGLSPTENGPNYIPLVCILQRHNRVAILNCE